MIANHEQDFLLRDALEALARHGARAKGRVAEQDPPVTQPLDHHKVVVTVLADQRDRRNADLLERLQRRLKAVGLIAQRGQIVLHVE